MPRKSHNTAIANVLSTAVLVVAVCFAVFAVVTTLSSGKGEANLLGWKPYIVLSDSMKTEFQVGDVAFSHAVDPHELRPGDIVTFASIDPDANGQVLTHKIREIIEYQGEPAFVTYGTATGDNDAYPVPFSQVVGRYEFSIPRAGYVFEFLKSPLGYALLVLVPFGILIGLQVRGFVRLLRESHAPQATAVAPELERLERERARLERRRILSRIPPIDRPLQPEPVCSKTAPLRRAGSFDSGSFAASAQDDKQGRADRRRANLILPSIELPSCGRHVRRF